MKPVALGMCCLVSLMSIATIASAAASQSKSDAERAIETNQTCTVRGRVVDTRGEPIKSAYVDLLVVPGYPAFQLRARIDAAGFETGHAMNMFLVPPGVIRSYAFLKRGPTTDQAGRYEITGIPGGFSYQLEATGNGYGWDRGEEFLLEQGEVYEARDLILPVADMSIEGTVKDAHGEAVGGASVMANGALTGDRRTETDKNGRFRLENLVDEQIRIWAYSSGPSFYEAPVAPESPSSADSRRPRGGFRGHGGATAWAGDDHVDITLSKGFVLAELAMYHPKGHIRGEMSLTDDIWSGIDDEDELKAKKGPIEFFTLADLRVGDVALKADQSGWTWNGKAEPAKDGEITPFGCVKLDALPGKWAVCADVQTEYHQYFDRRADGLFELKIFPAISGIQVGFAAERAESGRIILRDLTVDSSTILRRRPIEGVNLNIGPPIFREPSTTTVSLEPGRYYGMLMPTSGGGNLLIRLRVDVNDPAEGESR